MAKHYQESEIEFRRKPTSETEAGDYPESRGIIVHQYGGTIEECVRKARVEFNLHDGWEVVRAEKSSC